MHAPGVLVANAVASHFVVHAAIDDGRDGDDSLDLLEGVEGGLRIVVAQIVVAFRENAACGPPRVGWIVGE